MKRVTLYIGLNDRVTKVQEISTPRAREFVYDTLFDYGVCGFTFHAAIGAWQYDDGSVHEENTFVIEIMTEGLPVGLVRALKDGLNQESIGVVTEIVHCEFV